ncbi:hypothetical protein ACQPYE_27800 [Actinosynnema sp. CA-299493]
MTTMTDTAPGHETLRNWARTAEQAQAAPPAGGVSADERQELRKHVAEDVNLDWPRSDGLG